MRAVKSRRALARWVLSVAVGAGTAPLAGCWDTHTLATDSAVDALARDAPAPSTSSSLVWVLVHPSYMPAGGPGILLFDETAQSVVRRLPLPDPDESPHGLAWDGRSLWLASTGIGIPTGITELDPETGAVRQRWSGMRAEGVTVDGETLWYIGARRDEAGPSLVNIRRDGAQVSFGPIPESFEVQDLVMANGALHYLANDGLDRIMRIDPSSGSATLVASGVDEAPYALGFDGTYLAVAIADRFRPEGIIRRFDPLTGALVRESPLPIDGWVTAIAFVR